jgi:hypothetical protein
MKARKQKIRSQMKFAVNSGDQKKLEELTMEFNKLILRQARDDEQSRTIKG